MIEWIQSQKKKCKNKPYILVIDGMSASGKTTLGLWLAEKLDAALISMDDFFLPADLRTAKRLQEVGGNIYYERFYEEIIKHLKEEFSYRVFNCKTQSYDAIKRVANKDIIIIEGAYSMHPYFGRYYDDAIFMKISAKLQMSRVEHRNQDTKELFFQKWIPFENRYFEEYAIEKRATRVLKID